LLPEEVHARLREEAHHAHLSMADLIRRKLETKEAPDPEEPDPLLEVAGIGSDGTLCDNLDEDLYEI
jgi:hypothetical protein